MLRQTETLIDRLGTAAAWLSGLSFMLLSFYITWEALARWMGWPYSGFSDVISGYVLAVGGTWGMSYALRTGAHVRVEVVLQLLPVGLQRLLTLLALALLLVFVVMLAWYSWVLALESWEVEATDISMLGAPLVIPQGLVAIGFCLLAVQCAAVLLRDAVDLFSARPAAPAEAPSPTSGAI